LLDDDAMSMGATRLIGLSFIVCLFIWRV